MLRYNIVRLATTKILTTPTSKRSLKAVVTSTAKQARAEQRKSISPEFVALSRNESDSDISMLTPARQQKLARRRSMLKYSDDSVEKDAGDDLLGDDLLDDDPLSDDSPAHINSNIDMDTKAKSNPDEDMTGDNLLEENSGINIEELFQQVRDQTIYEKFTRDILEQTCSFF